MAVPEGWPQGWDAEWPVRPQPYWALSLWFHGRKRPTNTLLYGWLVPVARTSGGWSRRQFDKQGVWRLTYSDTKVNVLGMASAIARGQTLAEASATLGKQPPSKKFRSLRVVQDIESWDASLPFLALPFYSNILGPKVPASSPSYSSAMVVSALVRRDHSPVTLAISKEPVGPEDRHQALRRHQRETQMWDDVVRLLSDETGLRFGATDLRRVGNFELVCPLESGAAEDRSVQVDLGRDAVRARVRGASTQNSYRFRCRQLVAGMVVRDRIVAMRRDGDDLVAEMEAVSPDVSATYAEIWRQTVEWCRDLGLGSRNNLHDRLRADSEGAGGNTSAGGKSATDFTPR